MTRVKGGVDTPGRFSVIVYMYKGDNFYNFLFAFLFTQTLLKRGLLLKERIYSQGEQILFFKSKPLFRMMENDLRELYSFKMF